MEVSKKSLRSFALSELSDARDNVESLLMCKGLSVETISRLQYAAALIGAASEFVYMSEFDN